MEKRGLPKSIAPSETTPRLKSASRWVVPVAKPDSVNEAFIMATQSPSAVRLYVPDHPALVLTVRARIETQRKILIEQLGTGYASSWDDYNRRSGVIQGMDEALELIAKVEKEMTESDR